MKNISAISPMWLSLSTALTLYLGSVLLGAHSFAQSWPGEEPPLRLMCVRNMLVKLTCLHALKDLSA